jgi:hypothetical protein
MLKFRSSLPRGGDSFICDASYGYGSFESKSTFIADDDQNVI